MLHNLSLCPTVTLLALLAGAVPLWGDLPQNMVIGPNMVECDGCARLRNLVFKQIRIHGHIDAYDCEFNLLDASGFVRLINTRITDQLACRGELVLRNSFCAKVCAATKLVTLENAHIGELFVELLVSKNKIVQQPKVILNGTSSIDKITFVDTTGSVIVKGGLVKIGPVIGGTVLTQLPTDQK